MDANFSNFIRAMEASGLGNQSTGRTPAIREDRSQEAVKATT
jgi:hypothetical protein